METRDHIIDNAYKLFLNHSYEAVSISVISKAVRLTKGALYHHFKNKEELFEAVINKHLTITTVKVDFNAISLKEYTDTCIQHTQKVLNSIYGKDKQIHPINLLALIADSFRHCNSLTQSKFKIIDEEVKNVEIVIGNAMRRGEIRSDIDFHVVALQYSSLSMGLAGELMRNGSIDSAIKSMSDQLNVLYKLLKL